MKHEIHRMRPVFAGNRCCGFLIRHIRGFAAHAADGRKIDDYPEDGAKAAVRKLRFIATERNNEVRLSFPALSQWPTERSGRARHWILCGSLKSQSRKPTP
jgi:hypothetical protein